MLSIKSLHITKTSEECLVSMNIVMSDSDRKKLDRNCGLKMNQDSLVALEVMFLINNTLFC